MTFDARGRDGRKTTPIEVLVADQDEFARIGLRSLLERGEQIIVAGEAGNAADALEIVAARQPKVVLVDSCLPPGGWLQVNRGVLAMRPQVGTAVVVMAAGEVNDKVIQAIDRGVRGYLFKNSPDWLLSAAVRSVAAGDVFLAGPVIQRLFTTFTLLPVHGSAASTPELDVLNKREFEVVRGIGYGLSNREISRRLGVAENTIKSYVSRIIDKLGARNRVDVALTAYRLGVVPPYPRDPTDGQDRPHPLPRQRSRLP